MTIQPTPSSATSSQTSRTRRMMRWLVIGALGVAILLSVARLLFFNVWEGGEFKPPRWDGEPRFVETTYPKMTGPPNATLWQRINIAYLDFRRHHGGKNPAKYSFPASSNQPCSIHGLLTQCMEVSGTKYLIAQEVSSVEFGHTNVLNGPQWVAAFERALQTNQPQCFHPASNRLWRENLLLIRETPRLVKVIPPSRLSDYQKAGLVSPSFVAPRTSSQPALAK